MVANTASAEREARMEAKAAKAAKEAAEAAARSAAAKKKKKIIAAKAGSKRKRGSSGKGVDTSRRTVNLSSVTLQAHL